MAGGYLRLKTAGCLRSIILFFAVAFAFYGFDSVINKNRSDSYCPRCVCNCPELQPARKQSQIIQDCGRDDPELRNETKKRFVDLLTEELLLQKVVAEDNKRHANFTLGQAKRAAFHFLKETEKCNAAMETCEARREEAEMSLRQVRKETAMWELRARKFGWSA